MANQIAIVTVEQLKTLSINGLDCHIRLNFGVKSSKHIWWDDSAKHFEIVNYIDDTEQCLSEKQLFTESNIGKAITMNALFTDN